MIDASIKVDRTGWKQIQEKLQRTPAQMEKSYFRNARAEAEILRTESMREVPVLTGRLRNSARVVVETRKIIVEYATPYAFWVHEMPRPPSSNGKWKFLEDPFNRWAVGFSDRIEARMAAEGT